MSEEVSMTSKGKSSLSELNREKQENISHRSLVSKLRALKAQIQSERMVKIKEKLEMNAKQLESIEGILSAKMITCLSAAENDSNNGLCLSPESAIYLFNSHTPKAGDKEGASSVEALLLSSKKIPYVEKIPRYVTWVFLQRNQKAYENNSLIGKRLIYYNGDGDETLICSDSDEERREKEEVKYEFSEGEDRILWLAFEEHGLSDEVADLVKEFVGGTSIEIQDRYKELKEKVNEGPPRNYPEMIREKRLSDALDSYNSLFCRRCKVFDCRLHGWGDSVYPHEKQPSWSEFGSEFRRDPCSDSCYLRHQANTDARLEIGSRGDSLQSPPCSVEGEVSRLAVPSRLHYGLNDCSMADTSCKRASDDNTSHERKQIKKLAFDIENMSSISSFMPYASSYAESEMMPAGNFRESFPQETTKGVSLLGQLTKDSTGGEWKPLERDLVIKGIEIFGRNSCLIARNLLSGWKTCNDVYNYMLHNGTSILETSDDLLNVISKSKQQEQEAPGRSKPTRRRGKARRRLYYTKSAARPSASKKNGKGPDHFNYTPCDCYPTCGKGCPCSDVDNCCEKFCGCPKGCKNRFRGCHCAKSQCRTPKCPCYASNRECDPDVCRNCWVSCGDGTLGEPPKQGEGQCGNMRILLRQQQRILLGRSDVTGWGAFIKNSVNKNEYLGEYTGELISNDEADRRGKVYDRVGKSFLFNVNDEYCLDAFREGDKLKFANHSFKPNCYCRVFMVQGDHRIAIFSKERIAAKQELFYNYSYGEDTGPSWAHGPQGKKNGKGDPSASEGRAKKYPAT